MTKKDKMELIFLAVLTAIVVVSAWVLYSNEKDTTSLEAVKDAAYTINDGHSLEAVDYAIITDMDSGMQYIYFEGYGVSPLITADGEFSKTVE